MKQPQIKTYDCTSGGAQWCQGCYTMDESLTDGKPDGYGEWVSRADHEAVVRGLQLQVNTVAGCTVYVVHDERAGIIYGPFPDCECVSHHQHGSRGIAGCPVCTPA